LLRHQVGQLPEGENESATALACREVLHLTFALNIRRATDANVMSTTLARE
jgi:hypothetical protein